MQNDGRQNLEGDKDLSQQGVVPAVGDSSGGGAEQGVDHGQALPTASRIKVDLCGSL